jgi:hypothetical protein
MIVETHGGEKIVRKSSENEPRHRRIFAGVDGTLHGADRTRAVYKT